MTFIVFDSIFLLLSIIYLRLSHQRYKKNPIFHYRKFYKEVLQGKYYFDKPLKKEIRNYARSIDSSSMIAIILAMIILLFVIVSQTIFQMSATSFGFHTLLLILLFFLFFDLGLGFNDRCKLINRYTEFVLFSTDRFPLQVAEGKMRVLRANRRWFRKLMIVFLAESGWLFLAVFHTIIVHLV